MQLSAGMDKAGGSSSFLGPKLLLVAASYQCCSAVLVLILYLHGDGIMPFCLHQACLYVAREVPLASPTLTFRASLKPF